MKKLILVSVFAFATCMAFSQDMVLHDPVTGKSFSSEKYSEIRGTPFLYDKWIPGTATSARGIYKDLQLKLDSYNNILYFYKDETPYEFQEPIKSFMLINPDTLRFKKGISGSGLKADQWVQVFTEGKIGFYRSDIKLVSEMSEINVGMVKTFTNSSRYYISKDGKTELVKLSKGDIFEHIKDKEDQVKAYIDANNIGTKKEGDFAKILRYYNSL